MSLDTFDLERVSDFISECPDCEIVIIANNRRLSEMYWKRIQEHIGIKKRPWIITNANTWDGIPVMDSLILKIGRWWENRNAIEFLRTHTRLAKMTLPITFIPPYTSKGGDD